MSGVGADAVDAVKSRYVPPWRNPWRKPYFLATVSWAYVLWSIIPVVISIQFSFNAAYSRSYWGGFSTQWYCCSRGSVRGDPSLQLALQNSVLLAIGTVIVAVPLGTALALGLTRWRSRTSKAANVVNLLPLVTPQLIMGSALYLIFSTLYSHISLGLRAMLLGHVTLSLSFVLLIVRARLVNIDAEFETAAQDLGASRMQAIRTVLLPLLMPAVFASATIVFALSLDNFVVSNSLFGSSEAITVPVKLYSAVKGSPSPALNALTTILLACTLTLLLFTYLILRRSRRRGEGVRLS